MSRKQAIAGATMAICAFLVLSMAIALTPANQEVLTSDQQILMTLALKDTQDASNRALDADQSTQIAALHSTVDTLAISTLVATFTSTQVPTIPHTNTPASSPTATIFLSPTQEVLTTPFTATPTFQLGTNTYTPTSGITITPSFTPTPTDLPTQTLARNISGVVRNVRSCPSLTCEIVAQIGVNGTVALDISQSVTADGYKWRALWNNGGWIATERLAPFEAYFQW